MSATERIAIQNHRCPECRASRGEHCVSATARRSNLKHPHKARTVSVVVTTAK